MENIPLLEVKNLHTSFKTEAGEAKAVNGLSFSLYPGEILGIVGESGSGKSMTAWSIMRLVPGRGRIVEGDILYKGQSLLKFSEKDMRQLRGGKISMIFQDPMTSLNPVYTIGSQLVEAVRLHSAMNKKQAAEKVRKLLDLVGINDSAKRMKEYPHELSGGMMQRVMIAMALSSDPEILIADEPTTALDPTIQSQILDLIRDLQKKMNMSVILISHNLGIIAEMCDKIIVMYAGKICEEGNAQEIFHHPAHEYTKGLMRSIPSAGSRERLIPISGTPPDILHLPQGCSFFPRCPKAMKICAKESVPLVEAGENHVVSCWEYIRE